MKEKLNKEIIEESIRMAKEEIKEWQKFLKLAQNKLRDLMN